jgi:hypothetical protein
MKLTDWLPVIPAIQNGWTLAALIAILGLSLLEPGLRPPAVPFGHWTCSIFKPSPRGRASQMPRHSLPEGSVFEQSACKLSNPARNCLRLNSSLGSLKRKFNGACGPPAYLRLARGKSD